MNVLRNPVRQVLRRSYGTVRNENPFAMSSMELHRQRGTLKKQRPLNDEDDDIPLSPPTSPTFYTGRSEYFDQIILLQDAIVQARKSLKALYLLPLPEFARQALPTPFPMWKDQHEMSTDFQSPMSRSRYRRVLKLLNELNGYYNIAKTANASDVKVAIGSIVALFESGKKAASFVERQKKPTSLDQYGRSYSVGRRKTSSARVWIIPVHAQPTTMQPTTMQSKKSAEGVPDYQGITTSTILINNIPLAEYFPLPVDRERIMRPFKVAGVVGAYNVFALVRGGGTTGQSGALSHGIAKGLVIHEPKLAAVLKKAQLTRRDPRMVERKKTGLAKARKRYTWVKR